LYGLNVLPFKLKIRRCHAHTDGIHVNHNYRNIDIKTELLFNIISIHIYPLNNPFHLIRFSKNFVYPATSTPTIWTFILSLY
jgi:hypothetical protein